MNNRYGVSPATVIDPDPEGVAMETYMATTDYYTEEGAPPPRNPFSPSALLSGGVPEITPLPLW